MNAPDYDTIAANVARVDVNDSLVQVTWQCPATGRQVGQSSAHMTVDHSLAATVGSSVKRSIVSELVYGVTRFISGLVGGAAGRVVSHAAYTAAGEVHHRATAGAGYTEASRRSAIVAAFAQVQPRFEWDAGRRQFVARSAPSQG